MVCFSIVIYDKTNHTLPGNGIYKFERKGNPLYLLEFPSLAYPDIIIISLNNPLLMYYLAVLVLLLIMGDTLKIKSTL